MKFQLIVFLAVLHLAPPVSGQIAPLADYHQHVGSRGIEEMLATPTGGPKVITAKDVISLLDTAGIRRALVLSVAYLYGSPARSYEDEYARVRAENDWTGEQAAQYPERLRAFCSFNPLKPYALEELSRCAATPHLRYGVKMHFGNSDVQLDDPAHVDQLRRVFRAINEHRMAIVVHVRASISKSRPYGPAQTRIFIEQLLPLVPDVPVQIAHMAGSGPGYDSAVADKAMGAFAEALERGDPRTRQLWFDVASVADEKISPEDAALLAKRIRQVGVARVLYGSDAAWGDNLRPAEGWAAFRRLPLTAEELTQIAANVAPYLK